MQVCEVDDDFEYHDTGGLRVITAESETQTDPMHIMLDL